MSEKINNEKKTIFFEDLQKEFHYVLARARTEQLTPYYFCVFCVDDPMTKHPIDTLMGAFGDKKALLTKLSQFKREIKKQPDKFVNI